MDVSQLPLESQFEYAKYSKIIDTLSEEDLRDMCKSLLFLSLSKDALFKKMF